MTFKQLLFFILFAQCMFSIQSCEEVIIEKCLLEDSSKSRKSTTRKEMELIKIISHAGLEIPAYEITITSVPISILAVSPDCSFVASVTSDYTIEVWDSQTKTLSHILTGLTEKICSLAIAPDNSYIVAGTSEGSVMVWDRSGKLLSTLIGHTDAVRTIVIINDSNSIITGSRDGKTRIWNHSGMLLETLEKNSSEVKAIIVTPTTIATLTVWGCLKIWNRENKKTYTFNDFNNPISAFAVADDASFTVISYLNNQTIVHYAKRAVSLIGHSKPISTISITPDTTKIITGSADNSLKIWNANTGGLLHSLSHHDTEITTTCISHDGALLVSCSADKVANIWEIASGKLLHTFPIPVSAIAFAPDNSCYVATEPKAAVRMIYINDTNEI